MPGVTFLHHRAGGDLLLASWLRVDETTAPFPGARACVLGGALGLGPSWGVGGVRASASGQVAPTRGSLSGRLQSVWPPEAFEWLLWGRDARAWGACRDLL